MEVGDQCKRPNRPPVLTCCVCVDCRLCGFDQSKYADLNILLTCLFVSFYGGDVGCGLGDQCKRPIRPPPAHTTGMIHSSKQGQSDPADYF